MQSFAVQQFKGSTVQRRKKPKAKSLTNFMRCPTTSLRDVKSSGQAGVASATPNPGLQRFRTNTLWLYASVPETASVVELLNEEGLLLRIKPSFSDARDNRPGDILRGDR